MFDFAWSEFALIAVVALICIGPKDMPVAIRAVTGWIKKARRMAGEFQGHVDEMMREADLHEVRDHISQLRNFNLAGTLERVVDSDGSIRRAFDDPTRPTAYSATSANSAAAVLEPDAEGEVAVEERPAPAIEPLIASAPDAELTPLRPDALPDFIPPAALAAATPEVDSFAEAPAFIPPAIARARLASPPA
jgi:sec-independent protein translocase protein TatB